MSLKRALVDHPLGAVALVVEHDHRDRQPAAHDRGELHAGHLEGAVAHERDDLEVGPGHFAPRAAGTANPIEV